MSEKEKVGIIMKYNDKTRYNLFCKFKSGKEINTKCYKTTGIYFNLLEIERYSLENNDKIELIKIIPIEEVCDA